MIALISILGIFLAAYAGAKIYQNYSKEER